jgi:hypothetical protein
MHLVELTVADNEASDLLRVEDPALLADLEAESAFWTVLDEGPVEKCLALLMHSRQGWTAAHVAAQAGQQAGSIDALDKGSVLLDAHPQARDATCRHLRFTLPERDRSVITATQIADLAPLHHVEGIAEWQGRSLYVTDEDHRVALYVQP